MFSMIKAANRGATYAKFKVDAWFKRVFKEQAGGAELIATLIIVGIVLILAFAFKQKLIDLVKGLWNSLLKNGDENTTQGNVVNEWT